MNSRPAYPSDVSDDEEFGKSWSAGQQRASGVLNAPARHPTGGASQPPTQAVPECLDSSQHLPNAHVHCWTMHQVTSTRCSATAQVAHRFEAFQKSLPGLSPLQPTAVAQPITCWHVTALNTLGRLTVCAVQPRPDVESAWTCGGDSLDVGLVMIGYDFLWDHPSALDSVPKEGFGTGRVAALAEQDIDNRAVFIDRTVQVELLPLPEQEHTYFCRPRRS